MRAIDGHVVEFGELAGPLCRGSTVFDWQIVALQAVAASVGHPFEVIVADGGVPFAPVVATSTVHRYPTLGETIDVDVVPVHVGETSVELVYEVTDDAGERVSTARATHVVVGPDGGAQPLPERTRAALLDDRADRDPSVGPEPTPDPGGQFAAFSSSFDVRSPHVEGVEWGYFEEYPRFAAIAAEEYLDSAGTSLGSLTDGDRSFRPRAWSWEFRAPVPLESTLEVGWDVVAADRTGLLVEHTFRCDDRVSIEGVSEYGCFDRTGTPRPVPEALLVAFGG